VRPRACRFCLYIFLSVIGGLQAFGPPGLLYGPLILSFTMVMLRIYGEVFNDALQPGGAGRLACAEPLEENEDD